jgi:hypothetical protein
MNNDSQHTLQLVRRENFLRLYGEFLREQQQLDPQASVSGLSKAFASKAQIAGSSFSSIKSGARSIGDKVARQIEANLKLPQGSLDSPSAGEGAQGKAGESDVAIFLAKAKKTYLRASPEKRKLLLGLIENLS